MKDIPNHETFVKIQPINKGWSGDKKYYVEAGDGDRLLLRISDVSEYMQKKLEFENIKKMLDCKIK